MTKYNSKTYQIDGLDWTKCPNTEKFEASRKNKEGKLEKYMTNMVDYMKLKYNKVIKNPDQPLLFVNMRGMVIYLAPELCHEASLPDDFTKDSRKMRDIDQYKIKNPGDRYERIAGLVNRIFNRPDFSKWKIELEQEMARVQGTVLPPPTLIYSGKHYQFRQYLNREIGHTEPI